jgi:fatty-acyl-CoA synthase
MSNLVPTPAKKPGSKERRELLRRVLKQTGVGKLVTLRGMWRMIRATITNTRTPSTIYSFHAANVPDRPAFIWRDRMHTYASFDARASEVGRAFVANGVGRGQNVLLMMRNRLEFMELNVGAQRVSAPACSVSWRSTAPELAYLAQSSDARMLFIEDCFEEIALEAIERVPGLTRQNVFIVGKSQHGFREYEEFLASGVNVTRNVERADVGAAVVIFTSGTTGKPKGAVRTFPREALPQALRFIAETPMTSNDVHLVTCPLYHSTAYGFVSLCGLLATTVVLLDEFKVDAFVDAVEKYKVNSTAVVPTILSRLLRWREEGKNPRDLSSLNAVFTAGAPLPGPLANAFMDEFGDVLHNVYGATETGMVTLAKPSDLRAAPGTIGRIVPGNHLRLIGEDGADAAAGGIGELYVHSPMLVKGYYKNDAATKESMIDGYFSVGDLARIDVNGRVFIEGRRRDLIISGGTNVYPAEVESALDEHPSIEESAVVGVANADLGEHVRAFVVLKFGRELTEADLRLFLRKQLSGVKVPREYVFMDELPRNLSGKVLKNELRKIVLASDEATEIDPRSSAHYSSKIIAVAEASTTTSPASSR